MHREGLIDRVAAAGAVGGFEGSEGSSTLFLLLIRLLLLLLLQLGLQLGHGLAIKPATGNAPMLQSTAVEAWAVVIEALANDLAAADNNCTMAVVERRLGSLLEAEIQIVVRLHLDG